MSLALALSPACAHRTTEPSRGFCTPTRNYTAVYRGFTVNLIKSQSYRQGDELKTQQLSIKLNMIISEIILMNHNTCNNPWIQSEETFSLVTC